MMLVSLGLAVACVTPSVTTDYDPEVDFAQYSTFAWLPEESPPGTSRLGDSELMRRRVKRALTVQLLAKGIREAGDAAPDLLVGYHLGLERRLDVRTIEHFYTTPGRWHARYSVPETVVTEYDQGTVIIDFVDASEKRLVWRGVGTTVVPESLSSPEKRDALVREVVAAILAGYPPPSKTSDADD